MFKNNHVSGEQLGKYKLANAIKLMSLAMLLLLSACAGKTVDELPVPLASFQLESGIPEFNQELFGFNRSVVSDQDLIQLTEGQKQHFLKFFNAAKHREDPPFRRVASYLTWIVDEFDYSEFTYTASQTLNNKSGNCLSLAILTAALADLVKVDISFELMDSNPLFDLSEDYFVTSNHLRAVLKEARNGLYGEEGSGIWMRRAVRIDFFASNGMRYVDNINKKNSSSMYYSNIAVELMQKKQMDLAFAYAKRALEVYRYNWSALNSIGILHRRRGDIETAEKIYQYGIEVADKKSMFLKNYLILLENQSREIDAASVREQLLAAQTTEQEADPWHWIHEGRVAHKESNFDQAIRNYDKALAVAPDLHRVHMYTAIAHFQAGNQRASEKHFKQAIRYSPAGNARTRYERKLAALSRPAQTTY